MRLAVYGVLLLTLISTEAPAARRRVVRGPPACPQTIAASSTYFTPHIKDYCEGDKICRAFRKDVAMEGVGTLRDGRVVNEFGRVFKLPEGCQTAVGVRGLCLMPYLSVAADLRFNHVGDIIEMPALKNQKFILADGRTLTHPGFLIVQDRGGKIRGPNRFDFYVGGYRPGAEKDNRFATAGDLPMTDRTQCEKDYKRFSVIRMAKAENYEKALAAIHAAYRNAAPAVPTNLSPPISR